ncbi:MAG: hypothetical protein C4527_06040 [Candidatus Omnitrophota bacterium]|jgi:3',5'-cyclic AMP phosphodiesterase CpdA|nr:MAG: hypothetical protein C4527_06040 [Candidatus Omnitrophota bacterium]
MPHLSFKTTDRRTFLKTTVAAAGTVLTMEMAGAAAHADSIRWAFLSDTHVPLDPTNEYRGFRPYDNMQTIVPEILAANPEGVVITGDLARLEGFPGDYANLKRFLDTLAEKMPVCLALGNHDDRQNFLNYFETLPVNRQLVSGKYVLEVARQQARFLILDSNMYTNRVAGLLGKAQRLWLEDYLQNLDDVPVLLFLHHTLSDNDGDLMDVERLFRIIRPIRRVKAIVYGHSHEYRFDRIEGIHLINLPAVGYNFNDKDPIGWVEAKLASGGGDFTLHAIGGNMQDDGKTTSLDWRA